MLVGICAGLVVVSSEVGLLVGMRVGLLVTGAGFGLLVMGAGVSPSTLKLNNRLTVFVPSVVTALILHCHVPAGPSMLRLKFHFLRLAFGLPLIQFVSVPSGRIS